MNQQILFHSTNLENIQAGELRAKFSAAGDRILRYYVDVRHIALDLHKELSAPELSILQNKVDTLMAQWDKKYETHVKKQDVAAGKELAEDMTVEAELRRDGLRATLQHTLSIDDAVDWDVLKDHSKFERKEYRKAPKKERISSVEPTPDKIGFFQVLFGQRKKIEQRYQAAMDVHNAEVKRIEKKNAEQYAEWTAKRDTWNVEQDANEKTFIDKQIAENAKVDALEASWRAGLPEAVEEHASIVLEASEHDDVVPKQWDVQYDPNAKLLVVEYQLPAPDELPTTKTVRYVASTGELKETSISGHDKKTFLMICVIKFVFVRFTNYSKLTYTTT